MFSPELSALVPPSSTDHKLTTSWHLDEEEYLSPTSSVQQGEEQHLLGHQRPHTAKHITWISLAFITYFAVASGPFGIEAAVQAAGSLPVLVGIIFLPLLWGLPQALMTAELSSMIDENGGYIIWVRRGLGPFAGWMNAYNSVASNIMDLPVYPVLFSSYVDAYFKEIDYQLSESSVYFVKLVAVLLVVFSNTIGMRSVAMASIMMSVFILSPFMLEPFFVPEAHFAALASIAKPITWSTFLSTLIWNYQGWDSLGCIAGEVHDGGRTYPAAIAGALILITINYAIPVCVGVFVEPNTDAWQEGILETVAVRLSHFLGIWVGIAAVFSTLGEFNVMMATTSRALWATAKYRMLPSVLGTESRLFDTPIAAILFQGVTTSFLMRWDFNSLVAVDTFFNNLTLLLEFAAFLRLRYIEKDTPRPFSVPGGLIGAWIVTVPKAIVISAVIISSDWETWRICGLVNVGIAFGYVAWLWWQKLGGNDYTRFSPKL